RRAGDLEAIVTLGFRGEALPSIASVSHFVLRTRARGRTSGTEVRVNGGVAASVVEAAAAEGTAVEVNDLFYNLPARRKFLKTDAAESAQVSRIVTQLALAYPEAGFLLTSAGRTVLQCPPAASLRDRLYQLYGERTALTEVRFRDQSLVHEVVRRALMDALGRSSVPELQLKAETGVRYPIAAAIPDILGGGAFVNRWMPRATPVPIGIGEARQPGEPSESRG